MKRCFLLILICLFYSLPASAANLPAQELQFSPRSGGKFIYCNNPEAITNSWLADDSVETPKYLMNNEDLEPDFYSIYVSHINHTGPSENYRLLDKGFDLEVDVAFIAKEDSELTIHKTAFETPQIRRFYQNGAVLSLEDDYGSLNACAQMLGHDIYELDSDVVYRTKEQKDTTITLKKGETVWLSSYIDNYSAIAFRKTMHMAAEVELLSGKLDINVLALRSIDGKLKDRSHVAKNPAFGDYVRDRMHKGIADNLPIVDAHLSYQISDAHETGTHFPVIVRNQTMPDGYQCTEWCTHLNPQDDGLFGKVAAESDLMSYQYRDDSKLLYYGENVPEALRDNIYRFDAFHSDTIGYDGLVTGYLAEDYLPNYPLTTDIHNFGYCCSIGNYGVETKYHISIENTGYKARYFRYNMTTTANAIVMVEDKNQNLLQPVISRGKTEKLAMKTVAVVPLPAKATTEFIITVILPVNQFGGLRNSMYISDKPYALQFAETTRQLVPENIVISDLNTLLSHADEETQKAFSGNTQNYSITKTKTGYMARWMPWDGFPEYYLPYRDLASGVYFLDENFHLTHTQLFPAQPVEASYAKGMYYVKTADGTSYRSTDTKDWQPYAEAQLPKDNGGTFAAVKTDASEYISLDAKRFLRVEYPDNPPPYIEVIGDVYYYVVGDVIFISSDGVYWHPYDAGVTIETVQRIRHMLILNGNLILWAPTPPREIVIQIHNSVLALKQPPIIQNNHTLVPMRAIFEKLGMYVFWDEATKTATASDGVRTLEFTIGSSTAFVDGVSVFLDAPAISQNGCTYVPLRFLGDQFGYNVQWDAVNRIARFV